MKFFYRFLYTVFLCMVLTGCLVAPPHESLQRNCGAYPDDYEAVIMNYLKQDLAFSENIKDFSVTKTPEIVVLDTRYPAIRLHKGYDVWESFVVYEAKNDDGVYMDKDLHVAWIRHNRLVAFDYKGLNMAYRVNERISNPGY